MVIDLLYGYSLLKNKPSLFLETIKHEENKETNKTTKITRFSFPEILENRNYNSI